MRNVYVILAMMLLSSPILAATLNVNTTSMAPAFINTNSSAIMMNLTLNVTGTATNATVTVSAINVSLSNATMGNFSFVTIRNATNNGTLAVNSSFNTTDNRTTLRFSQALVVNTSGNLTLQIIVNTSNTATKFTNFSVNVTASSFEANDTAFVQGVGASNGTQIHNLRANASVTTRFFDTSVINQSFVYAITPIGTDGINKTVLNIPVGYTLVSLDSVEHDATNSTAGITNVTSPNQINITLNTPTTSVIILRMKLNTNSSEKRNLAFNSTLENGNLTDAVTDVSGTNTTVSTQQIVNVTNLIPIKNAAYLNGTDYWEFLFALNFTANVSGTLQFNMSQWNSTNTLIPINLSNGTYYATIRSNSNFNHSSKINITTDYNMTGGIALNTSSTSNSSIYLRMYLPSTVTVLSPNWWSIYTIVFRSDT